MPPSVKTRYRLESQTFGRGEQQVIHRLTDESAGVRIAIAPEAGAEIAGIQFRHRGQWIEILDRAEDYRPCDRWQGRAPWLWPAVGRSYTPELLEVAQRSAQPPTEFAWRHNGKSHPMPIHGFAMRRAWKVAQSRVGTDGVEIECVSKDDEETRRMYPFGFLLHLTYHLSDGLLRSVFRVEAAKGNTSPMPFCVGNHITVRSPLTAEGRFDDVRVFAPVRRVHPANRFGLLDDSAEISFREGVPLSDERLHNLVIGYFSADQATVRVVDPSGIHIEISQRELAGDRPPLAPFDAFYFVFYGSREHGFFCPEPWLGLPNALNTMHPCVRLEPGGAFDWEMTVRVGFDER